MDSHFSLKLYLEIMGNMNALLKNHQQQEQQNNKNKNKITKTKTQIEIYASPTTNKI